MSQLDAVVARARSPGQFVEERRFVLSRDKAVSKQREFTLRHPSQAVLELIQAAVFAGATTIAVETTADSLMVAWVGAPPLTADQLENWLDYLFADRGAAEMRPFVQLAVGLNALLQRGPKVLRVESGDGTNGVRMDLDRKGNVRLGNTPEALAATYVFAEFGRGWLPRFSSASYTEEQHLVEERCIYTPVPILLNGSAPFGYRGSRHIEIFGAQHQAHFDDELRRGVVAIHTNARATTGFRIVIGGVWVNTLSLSEYGERPLLGVLCDDRLRKTADHSDVVQDRRYVELLHAVQPYATQVMRQVDPDHQPARLPPIPAAPAPGAATSSRIEAEPLPNRIPSLPKRGSVAPTALVGCEAPLFVVTPEQSSSLSVPEAGPDRFPWQVLVLTEGQQLTLAELLPGAAIHRLSSPADLDFVRRVLDRQEVVRTHLVRAHGATITLRLHLQGRLPDWGKNNKGVPYCVRGPSGAIRYGVLRDLQAWSSNDADAAPQPLAVVVALPGVSILIDRATDGGLEPAHVLTAMHEAWHLAAPSDAAPHPPLLCALFGALARPQFVSDGDEVRVAASLPMGWPAHLRTLAIGTTPSGPLTLQRYLQTLGTSQVIDVDAHTDLASLDALEARFGPGHLHHPDLGGQPLFGVGRISGRWVWLEGAAMWSLPAVTQLCWVGATLAPRDHDDEWVHAERPHPELVAAHRAGVEPEDWEDGWALLHARLEKLSTTGSWSLAVRPGITVGRLAGMGQLALAHLTVMLDRTELPLFLPSDSGARRSLSELRSHRWARISAHDGAEVAEPWTFLLSADAYHAVRVGARPPLRFDDAPEVWDSLIASDDGWLIRREVQQGGLVGWLGLRFPYDPTAGVLVRTMGTLVALSGMDRRAPCHGLLWPEDAATQVSSQHTQLVRLAGLQLYQDLVAILRDRRDPARTDAANLYAMGFVLRAASRGPLSGAAEALASLVAVTSEGQPWGTLASWLSSPDATRPDLPIELPDASETLPGVEETPDDLGARLRLAIGDIVRTHVVPGSSTSTAVRIDTARSHPGQIIVSLTGAHPLVAAALAGPGRARELVLLEAARQVVAWADTRGIAMSLGDAQQALIAQRVG